MKNNFWTFSDEQKSMFVAQTSERVGLPPQAVEKDWWVTMTLKALFESSCRDFITFKGGTSLSKGWHVIERFSEDIDIAIDKSFWRIAGDNKSQRDRILENALATVYEYTDKDLGDAVDGTNRQILRRRLLYLACMTPVPNDVPQVRLRHDRVSYGDLCHYGWNVWNAFKGATNRFYDQTELAEWLKASFESLAKYNTKTLRAKLRATDGGYRIRLLDNLKEYIQK